MSVAQLNFVAGADESPRVRAMAAEILRLLEENATLRLQAQQRALGERVGHALFPVRQ